MNQGGTSIGKERGKRTKVASQVYTGQHICSTEPCLLNPISHCRNRVLRCQGRRGWSRRGGWNSSGSEELAGLGASTRGRPQPDGREGQEGAAVSVMSVSAVWVGVGAVQARLSALVELLATRCHQEHTLSLGTSRTWERATAAACTENTPLDPATSSSWQADF